jgi:hypothetical protein
MKASATDFIKQHEGTINESSTRQSVPKLEMFTLNNGQDIGGESAQHIGSPKYLNHINSSQSINTALTADLSTYDLDKKKYGVLLPKSGVYFLPDERIINLLRVMNFIRKRCEQEQSYVQANQLKMVFTNWKTQEQKR